MRPPLFRHVATTKSFVETQRNVEHAYVYPDLTCIYEIRNTPEPEACNSHPRPLSLVILSCLN